MAGGVAVAAVRLAVIAGLWRWRCAAGLAVPLCAMPAAVPRGGMSLMPRRAVTFGGTKVTKIPTGEGPRDPPQPWVAVFRNLVVVRGIYDI